jgi:hypothetical protein
VNGSPPPAAVVVTWPIELVGADDTVPPTELLVVSRLLVVALTVVVVAPLVEVAPEVLVAPLVVVGLTVVVVAPLVEVGLTVVVVAPVLVVGLTVVVVAPVLVVGYAVVVVDPLVVVVPPELVAEASCPTLTPANAIKVTAISQAAIRLRSFVACLAIDPYLPMSARPLDRAHLQGNQAATDPRLGAGREWEDQDLAIRIWPY